MGVKGLWQLLEPTGRPVTLESLEGKVLAVDVSIWLNQAMKGMRDREGNPLPNAHLLVLFNRICKLLFYRIKPIFVFDGGVPQLKKQTLAARRSKKEKAVLDSEIAAKKMVTNLMKYHAVRAVGGAADMSRPTSKPVTGGNTASHSDMFVLPPLAQEEESDDESQDYWDEQEEASAEVYADYQNLDDIDTESPEFRELPPEVQHEILRDMREARRHNYRIRASELPEDSNDFSSYQVAKLMKQSQLSGKIEGIRKDMNARMSNEMASQLTKDQYAKSVISQPVMSEDSSHFVLIKGLSKVGQRDHAESLTNKKTTDDERTTPNLIDKGPKISEKLVNDIADSAAAKDISTISHEVNGEHPKNDGSGHKMTVKPSSQSEVSTCIDKLMDDIEAKPSTSGESRTELQAQLQKEMSKFISKHQKAVPTVVLSEESSDDEVQEIQVPKDIKGRYKKSSKAKQTKTVDKNDVIDLCDDDDEETEKYMAEFDCFGPAVIEALVKPERNPFSTDIYSSEGGFLRGQEEIVDVKVKTEPSDKKIIDADSLRKQIDDFVKKHAVKAKSNVDIKKKAEAETDLHQKDKGSHKTESAKSEKIEAENGVNTIKVEHDIVPKRSTQRTEAKSQFPAASARNKRALSLQGVDEVYTKRPRLEPSPSVVSKPTTRETLSPDEADSDSDDEGFIEITVDPQNAEPDDELFPASVFMSAATVREVALTRTNGPNVPAVINPQVERQSNKFVSDTRNEEMEGRSFTVDSDNEDVPSEGANNKENSSVHEVEAAVTSNTKSNKESKMGDQTGGTIDDDTLEDVESDKISPESGDEVLQTTQNSGLESTGYSQLNLAAMEENLASENYELLQEMGRQQRLAATVTEQMTLEAQDLLRLFGLPFLTSPMEAEAQCAHLDLTNQTQGSVTDDSDVWLFGGQRVYRNFFNQNKVVEFYQAKDIETQMLLNRQNMIGVALLTGSDYTEGIETIGPIGAMEILGEFGGPGIHSLKKFKAWWDSCQATEKKRAASRIKKKLQKLELPEGFPNPNIIDAYLKPAVDTSEEKFTWSRPDLGLLREYAKMKLGWDREKIDETLLPVMKKVQESQYQSTITKHFQRDQLGDPNGLKSARLKEILHRMKHPGQPSSPSLTENPDENEEENGEATKSVQSRSKGKGRGKDTKGHARVSKATERNNTGSKSTKEDMNYDMEGSNSKETVKQTQKAYNPRGYTMPNIRPKRRKGDTTKGYLFDNAMSKARRLTALRKTPAIRPVREVKLSESSSEESGEEEWDQETGVRSKKGSKKSGRGRGGKKA